MHPFDRAYCPVCDGTNKVLTEDLIHSCKQCNSIIKHPECFSKSSFELIVDIDAKKTIPWWGWGVIIFMFFGFVIELGATYAYPMLSVYLKTEQGRENLDEVKTKLIRSDYNEP